MKAILMAFALFMLVLSAPAGAHGNVLDIQEVTSPGGIRAWLVEDHSVPVIALQFSFRGAGAVHDPPDKQGLAQLASNTMDEGAGAFDSQSFQKELRDLSIDLHFTSSRDHFGGVLKTLTKYKGRAFGLLHLALTKPRFDEEPVARMRRANQSRIRRALSDPGWIAARIMNDKAFGDHPYAQNSGGTLSTLENITPQDLHSFTKTLSRNRLVVSAAGDITAAALGSVLDQIFGALPESGGQDAGPDAVLHNQGKIFVYEKDIPQSVIEIMQPGIDERDPDYHTAQVMNFILGSAGFGSRLMKEIRETRGLTYGIYSGLVNLDRFNGLSVSTSTENANAALMLALIKDEWHKMGEAPPTEEELETAKSYLIGSLPLQLTSTDSIAGLLLALQLDGRTPDYLDKRARNIRAATAKDVQRVAQDLLDAESLITVIVGRPEGLSAARTAPVSTLPNVE